MASKKTNIDLTGMICCVGMIKTKNEDLKDLLVKSGYLLELQSGLKEKYPNCDDNYKIFVKMEDELRG